MSEVHISANDVVIGVDSGLLLRHLPEEGPRVVSMGDIMEILRWVHADLRDIHRAFSVVAKIEEEFRIANDRHGDTLVELGRLTSNLSGVIHRSVALGEAVESMREQEAKNAESQQKFLDAIEGRLTFELARLRLEQHAFEARLNDRWWKRAIARLRRKS